MNLDKPESQHLKRHRRHCLHLFFCFPNKVSPDYFNFRDVVFITAETNTFKCSRYVSACKVALTLILNGNRLFYCQCYQNQKFVVMRRLYAEDVGLIRFRELMSNFSNLGGYSLKIGYTHFPPHIFRTTRRVGQDVNETRMEGIEYNMLMVLSRKLNFTFQLIEVNTSDYDISYTKQVVRKVSMLKPSDRI
nr:unnamed protein product [Callosobruchus chinensis]